LEDLEVLCDDCHEKAHGKDRQSYRQKMRSLIPPWARRHPFPQGRVLARY
jgi:5-methylcytosine-specific restriction endonuclease McrA